MGVALVEVCAVHGLFMNAARGCLDFEVYAVEGVCFCCVEEEDFCCGECCVVVFLVVVDAWGGAVLDEEVIAGCVFVSFCINCGYVPRECGVGVDCFLVKSDGSCCRIDRVLDIVECEVCLLDAAVVNKLCLKCDVA